MKKRVGILRGFVVAAIVFLLAVFIYYVNNPAAPRGPAFPHDHLAIQRADGTKIPLDIEVATSDEQQAYGLMNRSFLPADAGMLFVHAYPKTGTMWMKDTLIPLDMLFVRADGTIAKIVTDTVPMDLTVISSGEPILGVIELNGGAAARLNLKVGDKVVYPVFSGR